MNETSAVWLPVQSTPLFLGLAGWVELNILIGGLDDVAVSQLGGALCSRLYQAFPSQLWNHNLGLSWTRYAKI